MPLAGNPVELVNGIVVSVAVIPEESVFAFPANVTSPADVVNLIGVTSAKLLPSSMFALRCVPTKRYFAPSNEIHGNNLRQVPKNVAVVCFVQPPIFSAKPFLNLTKDASNQPPALVRLVPSLSIPALN